MTAPPTGNRASQGIRVTLARACSKLGFSSRTDAVPLIGSGRVKVNGVRKTNPGIWVDLTKETVTVDGRRAEQAAARTIMFHKPTGCITTRSDERGRATVFDLLGKPGDGLLAVGRLDKETSGLLVLTTDRRLANALTDPATGVPKTYEIRLRDPLNAQALQRLRAGVMIKVKGFPYRTLPATAVVAKNGPVSLTIVEGKNRQVRKMIEALGNEVLSLSRTSVGTLMLGRLSENSWRNLSPSELNDLRRSLDS